MNCRESPSLNRHALDAVSLDAKLGIKTRRSTLKSEAIRGYRDKRIRRLAAFVEHGRDQSSRLDSDPDSCQRILRNEKACELTEVFVVRARFSCLGPNFGRDRQGR